MARVVQVLQVGLRRDDSHALEERPYECCGMLAGEDGRITRLASRDERGGPQGRPLRGGTARDPADHGRDRRCGADHLGIYHSHTHTRAYPSATDIGLAAYPVFYVIVSLVDFRDPQVKAYTITDGEVTEEPIEIV